MTIARQIKWDFKTNGDLIIRDKNVNIIYREFSNGRWAKYEYDSKGNLIYIEGSNGYWAKWEYDSKGNVIYFENSYGDWAKGEWDSEGNRIYFETSYGIIRDNRPKHCENNVVEIDGENFKLVKV